MEIDEKKDSKEYEISFLIKSEAGAAAVLRLVKQHGFEVTSEGQVKRITLAYKIKKETEGYFGFVHVSGDPESVRDLNHDLKTNPEVLRILVITPPFAKTKTPILSKVRVRPSLAPKVEPEPRTLPLSNEALEKKIEEILQ